MASVGLFRLVSKCNFSVSQLSSKVGIQSLRMSSVAPKFVTENVWDSDPELYSLIKKEKRRQLVGLEMIASENFTTVPVLQCLSSCLHNKYSEGLPGQRYCFFPLERSSDCYIDSFVS